MLPRCTSRKVIGTVGIGCRLDSPTYASRDPSASQSPMELAIPHGLPLPLPSIARILHYTDFTSDLPVWLRPSSDTDSREK